MISDRDAFQAHADVSRETMERLDIYVDLLTRWTKRINLVSPKSIPVLWHRHFLDSAQLLPFVTEDLWLDVGSGGGFPGTVVAIMSERTPVELIESDQRKATFLRTVARETGIGFKVHAKRVEDLGPQHADRLSARALAPLATLLGWADMHLDENGRAVFLKGASVQKEINEALEHWSFDCETYPSKTDADAVILNIGNIKRV